MKKVLKHAYGYIRASGKKGVSVEMQKKLIEEWAEKNERNLISILIDDRDSSKLPFEERKQLNHLIRNLIIGDILVTFNLSRLSRNHFQAMTVLHEIEEKQAYFYSIAEGYDTRTDTGVTTIRLITAAIEFQSRGKNESDEEDSEI